MAHPPPTREQFLERIRRALGRSGPLREPPTPPRVDDALVRLTGPDADPVEVFTTRAGEVGMTVRRCRDQDLPATLTELLDELSVNSVTLALDRLPMAGELQQAIRRHDVTIEPWRGDREMNAHYQVDAGVTDVHAALAETGTIVCCSDGEHGRGLSLAPPTHIAIVRRCDIVPDMLDYMQRQADVPAQDFPSAQAMITGPSKTADIEGVLITGVHGPGRVWIVLVEDG